MWLIIGAFSPALCTLTTKMADSDSTFDFNWDTDENDSDFEGFGPEELSDDSDGSDILWSSDDDEPLADLMPLGHLINTVNEIDVPASSWSHNLKPVVIDEFDQPTGPVNVLDEGKKEIDFFTLLFPFTLFQLMTTQTNLYASQKTASKPDSKWSVTSPSEMKAFVGIHILMSILDLPNYKLYWSQDWLFKTSLPCIMTRPRFEKLLQYFHLSDSTTVIPRGQPGHDKLHHIRSFMTNVQTYIRREWNLGRDVAIDEAMIAYKGRLGFKQYLPAKPVKFGIKVWEKADSSNGYVHQFQVYTGRAGNPDGEREVGLAGRVVLDLSRDMLNKNHHLNMDNFFSSPALFTRLLQDGIYACGTVRATRQ
ncbi:piggyBac transposable element-derived protein 4-like [Pecten maximus]|uniref:piggyBac transposable element-derived protein 4-like n=1 Tax=Pecten maximus TaxID=6579 RepID=UPI001458094C|nr:piggyBac transposable element-derived protein 4-like [Pecten maximus]